MLNKIYRLKNLLEGKKTYLLALAGTVLNILVIVDPTLLTQPQILKVDGILIALGGAALRASVPKP